MVVRRSRPGTRVLVAGGIALLTLALAPTGAVAAGDDHDVVSDFVLSTACMTGDQIRPFLSFHLEAGADTPASGRVVSGGGSIQFPGDEPYEFQLMHDDAWYEAAGQEPVWPYSPYFPLGDDASGDFLINLDNSVARSLMETDHIAVALYYEDGSVAAADQLTVNCFNEDGDTQLSDIAVTVRTGVPATVRLREYMLLSGVDGDGDTPRQAWVASPGLAWDADNRDADTLDDLVLQPAARTALGASLANQVLSLNATTAGDVALEWGAVTTPLGDEWTGGYGDRWGPAALNIHVIDGPVLPSDSAITESSRGSVAAPATVQAGASASLVLGADAAGEYVDVWLHSDPVYLGLMQVPADGVLPVTVPGAAAAGDHRLIVTDAIGTLIGWDDVTVTRAGSASTGGDGTGTNRVPRGATGLDEAPVRPALPTVLALAVLASGAGAVVVVARRDRRRVSR